ncbi:50S ribosomal L9 C-terminal domain-containing protein [Bdellovibrio bacteriovorus]|uniref:50S ribosomal L9 C-terminal domain-containing protein n=1 Tax=Bdellovibrio bacteriovorus TaxID=959 RepID=UPI0035A6302C
MAERQELLNKINGTTVTFKLAAGETDKLFGTVTTTDISKELQKMGHSVDRRDILLEEPIKVLGQHKAVVRYAEGMEAKIQISVERA